MIDLFKVFMPNVTEPLLKTLYSGYIGQGLKVNEFEESLAKYIGKNVTTNSCTSALQLSAELINVRGKNVISTPATCVATNVALLNAGAKIIWADIDPVTGNISYDSVCSLINKDTKAIMCVHYGGKLCDIRLNQLGIELIEDCAHRFNKGLGGYECYSFQAIKFLTTIDGGTLVCNNDESDRRARLLRWFGIDRNAGNSMRCLNPIDEVGFKFHMTDVNATIGLEQLKYIEKNLFLHKNNAKRYCEAFGTEYDETCDYWLYVINVNDRDEFVKYMHSHDISTSLVHGRNDIHPIFKDSIKSLPGVDKFYDKQVAIPVGWWLSDFEVEHIISKVNQWKNSH